MDWTPVKLRDADASALPKRVGRIRRRKTEDLEDWRQRAIQYLVDNPPKPKKQAKTNVLEDRFEVSVINAQEVFKLTDEQLVLYSEVVPDMPAARRLVTKTESFQKTHPSRRHHVDTIRYAMWEWITGTFTLRESEAICNLDCINCPTARLLNCAAQNLTAIERDAYPLPAVKHPGDFNGS